MGPQDTWDTSQQGSSPITVPSSRPASCAHRPPSTVFLLALSASLVRVWMLGGTVGSGCERGEQAATVPSSGWRLTSTNVLCHAAGPCELLGLVKLRPADLSSSGSSFPSLPFHSVQRPALPVPIVPTACQPCCCLWSSVSRMPLAGRPPPPHLSSPTAWWCYMAWGATGSLLSSRRHSGC